MCRAQSPPPHVHPVHVEEHAVHLSVPALWNDLELSSQLSPFTPPLVGVLTFTFAVIELLLDAASSL